MDKLSLYLTPNSLAMIQHLDLCSLVVPLYARVQLSSSIIVVSIVITIVETSTRFGQVQARPTVDIHVSAGYSV